MHELRGLPPQLMPFIARCARACMRTLALRQPYSRALLHRRPAKEEERRAG